MKTNLKIAGVLLALMILPVIIPKTTSAQQVDVSFQTFYDELSPYGEWVDYPQYGYVWIPDAGPDFTPYSTQGRWVYTEYGWTWVSNYEWGWAPFHYGRWDYDNNYGWLWVPDNQWGPSWVTWIRSDGYYGWQPMQPGMSISLSFGRDYRNNYDHWTFVRDRDFERRDLQRYYVDRSDHNRILQNYTVINQTYNDRRRNTTYISGPSRYDVQRVTGTRIRAVSIQENNRPGENLSNNRLRIYRPEIRRNTDNGHQAAPSRVVNLKDVKRSSERNAPNQSRDFNPTNRNDRPRNMGNPANQNRQVQPAQQKNSRSFDNKKMERRRNVETPQNQNRQVQPDQQQNSRSFENKRQEQQKNVVSPQNQNRQAQPDQPRVKQTRKSSILERRANTVKQQNKVKQENAKKSRQIKAEEKRKRNN